MDFRLLGPLEAADGGRPVALGGGKQRALLALLLLHAGKVVAAERLIDDLWGEDVPETAAKAVQIYVSRLRKVLPPGLLRTRAPGYLADLDGHDLDLHRFEHLHARGRAALANARPAEAAESFGEALALWRGPALAEFGEPFAAAEGARLEEARLACLEERIEADLALGRHSALVGEVEALVGRHPLRERLRAHHMLALYRAGRQAEALAAYQDFRRLLSDELGIEPSQPLRELERRMLQQDPRLDAAAVDAERQPSRPAGPAPRRASVARREEALERAFVGRDGELARLGRLLEDALTGHRHVAFLTGRPGMGKTTLVKAFAEEAASGGEILVAVGQCFEQYGAGEAFMPVLDALGRLSRGASGKDVERVLAERAPSWLSQLPGVGVSGEPPAASPGASRERLLRELVEALEEIAAIRPLVLVLEDLHWSDISTIDFIKAFARRDLPARALLLATFRPGDARASDHPVVETARELELRELASEIHLEALAPRAVADYLERRFPGGGLSAEVPRLLHERTGGNPLFLEKVVEAWFDAGSIAEVDGAFALTTSPEELALEVPATVRQLIELQLDQLDEPDRELIEAASAAGAEFEDAVLGAACARPEDEIEIRLAELARQERFVVPLGEKTWPDGTVATRYRFAHDLYQEIAYRRLPPGRRARLHRAIGDRLATAYDGCARDVATELATHSLRGREFARAVELLHVAAEQALARGGHQEAIEHLTTALGTLDQLPATLERTERELTVRITLGNALMEARGYAAEEVREQYQLAREACLKLDDRARLAPLLLGSSTIAEVAGRYREADQLACELLRLADEGIGSHTTGSTARGWPLLCTGRLGDAVECLAPVVRAPRADSEPPIGGAHDAVEALCITAWALWLLGRPEEAMARSEEAIALADGLGHPFSAVFATACDAFLRQLGGEPEPAGEQARKALRLSGEHGYPLWEAWASIVLGWAETLSGAVEAGIARCREGLSASAATGAFWARGYLLGILADAAARGGRSDVALTALDEADAAVATYDERFYEAELVRLRGVLSLARRPEDLAAAEEAFQRALAVAREQHARSLELRAATSLASLWRTQGRLDDASSLLHDVYGSFAEGLDTPDLRAAASLLAELPEPRAPGRAAGPVTPAPAVVVGRAGPLARLGEALEEARAGRRRVVLVTGEAGIGKTTLVETFLAESAPEGLLVGRGQCIEHRGSGEAYLPVLEALGRLGQGEAAADVVDVLRSRAPTWLVQLPGLLDGGELDSLQVRVRGATQERMLREMAEALDELSARRPVVLVLEDLHWADYSTVDLVEALARRPDFARLLLIATMRPPARVDAGQPAHALAGELRRRRLADEIPLATLPGGAVGEYLAARFPGAPLPDELTDLLYERTGGNPLFVEKVVDGWTEHGHLARSSTGWRLDTAVSELGREAPESVRELIVQRLLELDPADRELLETASVVGAEFASAAVAAGSERGDDEVETRLVALAAIGALVERRGEEDWPDATVSSRFRFLHDLFHEVLYERLPAGRRARTHARVGVRLEQAFGGRAREIAAELSTHFVLGRDARRAVPHLRDAAETALGRAAHREAADHLEAALALLDGLEPGTERELAELGLQLRLGPALIGIGGWSSAEAERALIRARELAEKLGLTEERASALFMLGTMHEVRGEYSLSESLLGESLRFPDRLPEGQVLDSCEVLACSLFHQGAFGSAMERAEEGLGRWDGTYANATTAAYGDSPGVACHTWAALSLWFLGRPDSALERAQAAVELSMDEWRAAGRAFALGQAAMVGQLRGEPEEARELAERAAAAAREGGFAHRLATAAILRGWSRAALGDTAGGLAEIRAGIEGVRAHGVRMDDPYYLGLLADALVRDGRHDDALGTLAEALAQVRASRSFFYEPELHRLRGAALRGLGRDGDAEAALREALDSSRRLGARPTELRAAIDLARVRQEQGEPVDAAEVVAAYSAFSEGFDAPDLVAARALIEELGAPIPDPPAVDGGRPAEVSPVRYARSGELSIAYQVTGAGPVDLVLVPGFVSHLEKDWEEPRHARFLERLGSFSRLIRFDKRGTGLSDRPLDVPDLETRMDDVRAVMDAAGSSRAVLFGYSEGGPMSILFAATYPDRVRALVLYGTYAKRMGPDDDYPWAETREVRAALTERLFEEWGFESHMRMLAPSSDDGMARWWRERSRAAASPGAVRALMEMNSLIDVRSVLPSIHLPTLVVHRAGDARTRLEEGRYIAKRIPGARLVVIPGEDHFVAIDPDQILDVVEPFVAEALDAPPPPRDRVLATILFTDVAGSTELATRLGDAAWADLLARHDRAVRDELGRFAGEEVDTAGDGFLALFDGPSRAVRCGLAIQSRLAELGLDVRVGVHTGEVERAGSDVRGIAVHLAARVAAAATPGELLVTSTTHDLVEGSGLAFEDRGERELKGIEGPRRVYAARA